MDNIATRAYTLTRMVTFLADSIFDYELKLLSAIRRD
jgi:hypothetical protein